MALEQAGSSCSSSSQGTQWLWLGSANVHLIMRPAASFYSYSIENVPALLYLILSITSCQF